MVGRGAVPLMKRITGLSSKIFFSSSGSEISASEQKRIEKEVLPLLRSLSRTDNIVYKSAREILSRVVVNNTREGAISTIDNILFLLACRCSMSHLPGYATLDASHINSIEKLLATIKEYVGDTSQKRPLTFLMLASPGAGKSHFIKCIAKQLASQKIGAITSDMAGLQSSKDMVPPLDASRNLKVEDSIPLLFLDEFDSAPTNVPLLLPLLWDGEVTIGRKALKLGKVIVVLAGSSSSLPTTMEQARSMRPDIQNVDGDSPKLVDLLSRINGGVFSIPPFFDVGEGIDRRADKVCILVHLLRQRFGRLLREVPLSLLKFVARTDFRYGVRSIAHLVNLIPQKNEAETLTATDLRLPFVDPAALKQSSIAYHILHHDQAFGVSKTWSEALCNDYPITIATELMDALPLRHFDEYFARYQIAQMLIDLRNRSSGKTQAKKPSRRASARSRRARAATRRSAMGRKSKRKTGR